MAGAAGVARVARHFDWSVVIPQYLALADDLAAMRKGAKPATLAGPKGQVNPLTIDPFALYAGYPSHRMTQAGIVHFRRDVDAGVLAALDAVNGRNLYQRRLVSDAKLLELARVVAENKSIGMADLAAATRLKLDVCLGAVLFLAKYDLVTLSALEPN